MDKSGSVVGIRKRQQIGRANRTMFFAIAGASVVVGFAVVLIIFLGQRIVFGEKVLAEKGATSDTLRKNLDAVPKLRENIRVLNTNQDLASVRLNDTDPPLQSVLDALPSTANSTAMASSLQKKLLSGVQGITIESLKVDSVDDSGASDSLSGMNTIGFSFSVSTVGNGQSSLKQVLQRIEESIRPFNVTNLTVESQGGKLVMTATGFGYYDPAQVLSLTEKVVKQ